MSRGTPVSVPAKITWKGPPKLSSNVTLYPCERSRQNHLVSTIHFNTVQYLNYTAKNSLLFSLVCAIYSCLSSFIHLQFLKAILPILLLFFLFPTNRSQSRTRISAGSIQKLSSTTCTQIESSYTKSKSNQMQ